MSEAKKTSTIDNIKGLTQIVTSGDLSNISKTVKELKRNVGDLKQNVLSKKSTGETATVETKVETAKVETKVEAKEPKAVETPKVEAKVEAPKAEVKVEAKPAVKEMSQAEKEARERAAAKALAIENKLKKYYSENGREGQNNGQGGNRRYDNNNQGGNRPYQPRQPRLDKDGKPYPPRQGGYNNNNQGGNRPYQPRNNNGTFDKDADSQDRRNQPKKPAPKPSIAGFIPKAEPAKQFGNKNKTKGNDQDKKSAMNKRTLIRKGFIVEGNGGLEDGPARRMRPKKNKGNGGEAPVFAPIKIEHVVLTSDIIPIKVLSEKIGVTATEITKKLFAEGIMKTVNESVDFATAEYIAMMYDITMEYKPVETAEEVLFKDVEEDEANLVSRPPVVTVMGHVDHGKTSLLDAIKNSHVTTGEAGGITQHIGAYSVEINGKKITFIDTPGHEAFTSMRKRGAQITDIAILVVAADDGVMPQTIEAINHIKAAGVEMIVAINKMDKPTANPDRIMQQLVDYEVLSEAWGGTTIMVPVSAHTRNGIDDLLESILLVAEVQDLKANPDRDAQGVVIEAKLDKGKGPMATVLVQNGTLNVGDTVISGFATGRIRAMIDDKGRNLKKALPSQAVSVLGLSEVPEAGERIMAVKGDKISRAVLEERLKKQREDLLQSQASVSLEDVFKKYSEGQLKGLNLIVKADVQGSTEAVKQSLLKLSNDEVSVKVIHSGVGAVNESDVMLASTSSAIIIAFNVRPDAKTKAYAEKENVEIKTYRIIYDAIEDISKALKGMLAPEFKERSIGSIEVRDVFKITGAGTIAGGYVIDGKIQRNAKARLVREGIVIFEGELSSLKRFKDDVKEVAQGYECGVGLLNYNDIKTGDIIECSVVEEIAR